MRRVHKPAVILRHPGEQADPYLPFVGFRLHGDGVNGATVFPELTGRTVTISGGSVLDTGEKMFGSASIRLPASPGNHFEIAHGAAIDPAANDFTFSIWFRPDNWASGTQILAIKSSSSGFRPFALSSQSGSGKLRCDCFNTTPAVILNADGPTTVTNSVWHLATVDRFGPLLSFALDGVIQQSTTLSPGNLSLYTNNAHAWCFGNTSDNLYQFAGRIDEIDYIQGASRYKGLAFTPPAAPFSDT